VITLLFALALGPPGACPMTIGVARDGTTYSDRFYGWYKVSLRTIDNDLRGGCYNDANPSRVTSVVLLLAPNAPKAKLDQVYSVLQKEGWGRDRVSVKSWDEKASAKR
jgi:hypothetical protein